MDTPRLRLLTIPDCHLCDQAREVVRRVAGEAGVAWVEDDLTQVGALDPLWWEQVPVVLLDGRVISFWRVEEARLREELDRAFR